MSVQVDGIWDHTWFGVRAYLQAGPDLQGGADLNRGLALTWLYHKSHHGYSWNYDRDVNVSRVMWFIKTQWFLSSCLWRFW